MITDPSPSLSSPKQVRIIRSSNLSSAMDYCFSTDSPNSTGSSSSSLVPNSTSKGKKKIGNNRRVKLSTDPQSVAARERRHRISDRFKILQSLVPGGSKMDTVSMLEEAIHYVKFLKAQIWLHQNMVMNFANSHHHDTSNIFFPGTSLVPSQEGLYSSNSTNLTTTAMLLQPSAVPVLTPSLSPPPPPPSQAFQDVNRFQGHQESISSLDDYIKY